MRLVATGTMEGGVRVGRKSLPAAVAVLVALALVLAGCAGRSSSADQIVERFVSALNRGDAVAAANLTDSPTAARPVIEQMLGAFPDDSADFSLAQVSTSGGDSGLVSLRADWDFGDDRTWGYTTDGDLTKLSIGWRLSWSPQLLVPNLGPGQTVELIRTDAAPPLVRGAGDEVLMEQLDLREIRIDPAATDDLTATVERVARIISPVAPAITAAVLLGRAEAAGGQTFDAVSLRIPDFEVLESALEAVPGVQIAPTERLVSSGSTISSTVDDDVRARWQAERDRTQGWAVIIDGPGDESRQVAGHQGPPPPDIEVTLDGDVQFAANNGVVAVPGPAALVALRPSDGAVLAVAQNGAADELGAVALQTQDPPGVIFTAFLRAAGVSAQDGGKVAEAARQLGWGVKLAPPGMPADTGTAESKTVTTTAYGMAVAAATIDAGHLPQVQLFTGDRAAVPGDAPALPDDRRDAYRRLMVDSVRSGALTVLGTHDGLDALTGVVDGDDEAPPGWLIGIRGDLAIGVYVGATDGTTNAVIVADQFFRALARGR